MAQAGQPICLLSLGSDATVIWLRKVLTMILDGGGVRGLSTIIILKQIMEGLSSELGRELQPWQLFSLIGGTSTGGIIGIMLGRLRMTLDECERAYLNLSRTIFTPRRSKGNFIGQTKDFLMADGKFDTAAFEIELKKQIRVILQEQVHEGRRSSPEEGTIWEDSLLKDLNSECRVFVAAARENNSEVALLRSYRNPQMSEVLLDECKIWEACRATSAAPTFFDSVKIGRYGQRFVDGGILYNNPIQLVFREASMIWPDHEKLLISIGTGAAPNKSFKGNIGRIIAAMKALVTQAERTMEDFNNDHQEMRRDGRLYRFNVMSGIGSIGLEEYQAIGPIADATQTYLDSSETRARLEQSISKLSGSQLQGSTVKDKKLRSLIVQWLSPLKFLETHDMISSDRTPRTGNWIMHNSKFKQWVSKRGCFLWCYGIPGAGKTILASKIIDHLEAIFAGEDIAITRVYLNYKERLDQSPVLLIGAILKQIYQRKPESPISSDLEHLFHQTRTEERTPTLEELSNALRNEVSRHTKVFVVVDALDEAEAKTSRRFMKELMHNYDAMNVLILSRSHIDLEFSESVQNELEIVPKEEDVRTYIKNRILETPRLLRMLAHDENLRSEIEDAIMGRMQGMFLLCRLYMDAIESKSSPNGIRKCLANLPEHLSDVYDQSYERMEHQNKDDRDLARLLIQWVTFTFAPLMVPEIQHALAIEPSKRNISPGDIIDVQTLISVCCGFVTVDKGSSVVRLSHYTVAEYFYSRQGLHFPKVHDFLGSRCLAYIKLDHFKKGLCSCFRELDSRIYEHPFSTYAAKHWVEHLWNGSPQEHKTQVLEFLDNQGMIHASKQLTKYSYGEKRQFDNIRELVREVIPDATEYDVHTSDDIYVPNLSPLHVAAEFGELDVLAWQLSLSTDIEVIDEHNRTPLYWAVENDNIHATEWLLAQKANPNGTNHEVRDGKIPLGSRHTALVAASRAGSSELVDLLVKAGANIEGYNDHQMNRRLLSERPTKKLSLFAHPTPLKAAIIENQLPIVERLLDLGANIDAEDIYPPFGTPLHAAIEKRYNGIARLLVARGADIDQLRGWLLGQQTESALAVAAQEGDLEMMQLLLGNGANTELGTILPLHKAIANGHYKAVTLLLTHGAHINVSDPESKRFSSTLHEACKTGNIEMIKAILKEVSERELRNEWDDSRCLVLAAKRGDLAVIKLLLENGAHINDCGFEPKMDTKCTPLLAAAYYDKENAVKELLAAGADLNAVSTDKYIRKHRDHYVWGRDQATALDVAILEAKHEIVAILRSAGGKGFTEI